jgi:hypothetical protein
VDEGSPATLSVPLSRAATMATTAKMAICPAENRLWVVNKIYSRRLRTDSEYINRAFQKQENHRKVAKRQSDKERAFSLQLCVEF